MGKYATASRLMALKDNDARERGRGIFVSADGGLIGTGAAPLGWPAWDYQQSANYNGRALVQGDQPWSDTNIWLTTLDDFDLAEPDYTDEMEDWDIAPCRVVQTRLYGEWEHEALRVPILSKHDSGRADPDDRYAKDWEMGEARAQKDAERDMFREHIIEQTRKAHQKVIEAQRIDEEINAAFNARLREYRQRAKDEGLHGVFTVRVKKAGRSLTKKFTMNTRGQIRTIEKIWA